MQPLTDCPPLAASPVKSDPADAELLAQIAAGNLGSFDRFVERYRTRLMRFIGARILDGHLVEDLTQETFLRLFRAAGQSRFAGRSSVATWVFSIANNVVADHLRFTNRRPLKLQDDLADLPQTMTAAPSPMDQAIAGEQIIHLHAALAEIPDDQRQVLFLRLYAELTYPEISELLGTPVPTVKSRFLYAIQKLERALNSGANRRLP